MFRILASLRSPTVLLILTVAFAACDGSGSKKLTASLTLTPAALSVAPGAAETVAVTLVRGGGFTSAVNVAATGIPEGVTISALRIIAGGTAGDLAIAVAATAAPGTTTISVTGTAAGVAIAPRELELTITGDGGAGGAGGMGGAAGGPLEGEAAYDQFGSAVALSADGTRLVVGAPLNDGTGTEAGHARVFERAGTTWVQRGADLDGEAAEDRFGTSVAITHDGGRVAVGAYLNAGGGSSSGNVRIYDDVAGAWTQVGADIDGTAGDGAGFSIGLSASGHRVVIGGPGRNSVSGDTRVYELTGTAWSQVGATITEGYEFADAVSISDDGNRIAVGQPGAASTSRPGTVYVYDWNGSAWTPVAAPIAGEALGDNFGTAVSLSGDGSAVAIGGSGNAPGGHLRVYRLTAGVWTQVGGDMDGVSGDSFGLSVSLSSDGTRIIGGGPGGSVARYYTLVGDAWTVGTMPMFVADSRAGAGVAISADGHTAAVGAEYYRGKAGAAAGAVRLYTLP